MSQKPKIKAAQLQRGYRSPHLKDGARSEDAQGRLTTKPSFTTSVKAQEKSKDLRSSYFGDNVKVVSGTADPTPWNHKKKPLGGACKPIPGGGRMGYTRPIHMETDANKVILGHTPSLQRWMSLLEEGIPVPLEVAAALRWVHDYPIYDLKD